jgi:hypothetical protein
MRTTADSRYVFDGSNCFHWDFRKKYVKVPLSSFNADAMYLEGLGLRPIDPQPDQQQQKVQEQFWFPKNFAAFEKCRPLPTEEFVDGAACVVIEAEHESDVDGKRVKHYDRIWFDPNFGYVPRKWERRVDGMLKDVRTNTDFEEFAPDCWLPWKSTWTRATPAWVAPEMRNQPAYTYNMRLRKVQINDLSDGQFKP